MNGDLSGNITTHAIKPVKYMYMWSISGRIKLKRAKINNITQARQADIDILCEN